MRYTVARWLVVNGIRMALACARLLAPRLSVEDRLECVLRAIASRPVR
jgi:hypothetical protein